MTEPGMEAGEGDPLAYRRARGVVGGTEPAEDVIRRLRDGEPMRYCDCGGPEDTEKPPIRRGSLPAVPLKPRDPDWFLTGSHYPTKPCKLCGSRDHEDCGGKR